MSILHKSIRPIADLHILIDYLKSLPEFTNMMKSVSENYEDLLFNVASALKYEKVASERIVIKFGEKGRKFFLVLRGLCCVLLPKEEKVNMNQDEYYNYLLQLKKHNEFEILRKVLAQNKNIYPLEEEEFAWLRGAIQTLKGKKNLTPFENHLFKFAEEECIEEIENLDFDIWKIFEKESYKFNSHKYEQKVLSADDYIKRLSPWNPATRAKEGKTVTAWVYHNIHSLKSGDKFGDMALTSTTQKRTATIVSENECHFGILEKNSFIKCLKDVSDRAKIKNVNFILSQKVFSDINVNIFQRNYFNQFVNKKLSIGELLITEGQTADKIFVIKEGEFEVSVKASNMELSKLIRKLGDNTSKLPSDFDLINGI